MDLNPEPLPPSTFPCSPQPPHTQTPLKNALNIFTFPPKDFLEDTLNELPPGDCLEDFLKRTKDQVQSAARELEIEISDNLRGPLQFHVKDLHTKWHGFE